MSGFISGASGVVPFLSAFATITSDGDIGTGSTLNVDSSQLASPGVYIIDFSSAGFTDFPQVFVQLMEDAGEQMRYAYLADVGLTFAEIHVFDASETPQSNRFRLWVVGV